MQLSESIAIKGRGNKPSGQRGKKDPTVDQF